MKKSLARKLLIYFVFLNLLSILIVGFFAYSQAREALIRRTFNQLTSVRIEKKKRVEDFFQQRIHEIQSLSANHFYISNSKNTHQFLESYINRTGFNSLISKKHYKGLYVYFSDKDYCSYIWKQSSLCKSEAPINKDNLKLFSSLINDLNIDIYEVLNENDKSNSEILICQTIRFNAQNILFAFVVNSAKINSIMLDRNPLNGLGNSGEAYLVGEDHLLRSTSRFHENSIFQTKADTKGVHFAYRDSIGASIFKDYRNIKVLSSFDKLNMSHLNWVILAEIDQAEAMIPIENYRNSMFYILIILSLLLLGIVALISNTITAPLRKLQMETVKISSGIYEQVTGIKADGEIMELVVAFNKMIGKIKEQQEHLKEAKELGITSMIDGQETERERLARELHDGLAQTILAIKMRLENATPENSSQVLADSKEMFAYLLHEIRAISNDLMPAVLREFGLIKALSNLLQQIEESSNLSTNLITKSALPYIDKKTETYLYRIAQEAINNTLKHAEASSLQINISYKVNNLFFEISDDGIGIQKKQEQNKQGNGLSNIQERVSVLGGKVYFENLSPQGFKIQCIFPIKLMSHG